MSEFGGFLKIIVFFQRGEWESMVMMLSPSWLKCVQESGVFTYTGWGIFPLFSWADINLYIWTFSRFQLLTSHRKNNPNCALSLASDSLARLLSWLSFSINLVKPRAELGTLKCRRVCIAGTELSNFELFVIEVGHGSSCVCLTECLAPLLGQIV